MALSMPFRPGDPVVVVLHTPRERVWGHLLGLEAAGITLRGLSLTPWEEVLTLVRTGQGDQVALSTRFLPMHRVEAMYLDEATSGVPSLAETFRARTGQDPGAFLAPPPLRRPTPPRRRKP
jgi:hypothetical protein